MKKFNETCDKDCVVHKLVTHNTCIFCDSIRNSPHIDVKGMSDKEIIKMREDVEREMD